MTGRTLSDIRVICGQDGVKPGPRLDSSIRSNVVLFLLEK